MRMEGGLAVHALFTCYSSYKAYHAPVPIHLGWGARWAWTCAWMCMGMRRCPTSSWQATRCAVMS